MRTLYELPCDCGTIAIVDPGQAGQTIVCGKCAAELTVPTLLGLKKLRPVDRDDPALAPRTWSDLQTVLFAVGTVVAFAGLMVVMYYGWGWWNVDHIERPTLEGITWRTDYDKLTPVASLEEWEQFNIELPQGRMLPAWYVQKQIAWAYLVRVILGVAIMIFGGLFACSAFLFRSASPPQAA